MAFDLLDTSQPAPTPGMALFAVDFGDAPPDAVGEAYSGTDEALGAYRVFPVEVEDASGWPSTLTVDMGDHDGDGIGDEGAIPVAMTEGDSGLYMGVPSMMDRLAALEADAFGA